MQMTEIIGNLLLSALLDLFEEQEDILDSSTHTGMTEWNFGHHYANSISKYLYWFDCDTDVSKLNHANKRPDIIFHKRKTNSNNFLVIELKLKPEIDSNDVDKIKSEWFCRELKYSYGACVSVKSKNNYVIRVMNRLSPSDYYETINETKRLYKVPHVSINDRMTCLKNFSDKEIKNKLAEFLNPS